MKQRGQILVVGMGNVFRSDPLRNISKIIISIQIKNSRNGSN